MASCKSVLPKHYLAHMAIYGWLSDQGHMLAHFFGDNFTSTFTCNYTPLESKLLTSYVANYNWLLKFGPFQRPTLGLFPHGKANKLHWNLDELNLNKVCHNNIHLLFLFDLIFIVICFYHVYSH